jgi:hypothetical protein
LGQVERKLYAAANLIKDSNGNGKVDDFEVTAAAQQAGLSRPQTAALLLAVRPTESSAARATTVAAIQKNLVDNTMDLWLLAKGGSLRPAELVGKDLSWAEVSMLSAAKEEKIGG